MLRCLGRVMVLLSMGLVFGGQLFAKDGKSGVGGLGFALSTGQSIFYTRGTDPFKTNQIYYATGIHIEEVGMSGYYYDAYGRVDRNPTQDYYFEMGLGWHRLLFQDKMAGGFFPHTNVQFGGSGYVIKTGRLRNFLDEFSLRWAPYLQLGFGGSMFSGGAIYRMEVGYLGTLPVYDKDRFPSYDGMYFSIILISANKPR
ncbi:MAG: hypothetical protein V3W14_08205 [Candidatus Neomarinimicrobiota bacterium]